MKKRLLAVVASLALAAPAAGASSQPSSLPVVTDPAGDANGINSQALPVAQEISVDTRPASMDGADIRAIYLDTLYDTIRDRDETGAITAVRHVAHSLRITFETTAPARPANGPTLVYRLPVTLDSGCTVFFQMYVRGTAPGAADVERADLTSSSCAGTLTEGFTLAFDGNLSILTYPFDKTQGVITTTRMFRAWTRPHVRSVLNTGSSTAPTAPAIDETHYAPDWRVGLDMPPDVICADEPDHPGCQE